MNLGLFRTLAAAIGAITLIGLWVPSAFAHAHLSSASPAAGAIVTSPTSIILDFTEPLEPRFSGFEILDSRGRRIGAPSHIDAEDASILTAVPAAPLAPGVYRVTWHIVAHDGHRMRGEYSFTVR